MSQATEDVLVHFGKKGMKWGVRNDKGHEGERAKTKKIAKLDKKFERNAQSLSTTIKIHNRAADLTNKNDIDRINNKEEYKGQDFTRHTPLREKYYQEHQKAYLDNVVKAASEQGTNASGTKKYSILEGQDGSWDVFVDHVQHADGAEPEYTVYPQYDATRHITSIKLPDVAAHGEAFSNDVLAHFGVKGMHWGVRRSREERMAARSAPSKVKVKSKPAVRGSQDVKVRVRAGRQATTTGGRRNVATEDAIRVAALRQKAKASHTDALSNHELDAAVKRMQLETKFKDLEKKSKRQQPLGRRIAEAILGERGNDSFVSVAAALAKD